MRDNARQVQRILELILVLNLAVAAAKAIYGWASGSLAVSADAVHSVLDAAANVVGMVALRLAATPPDAGHPYGHRKIEVVASSFVGVLIAGGALRFGWSAASALIRGGEEPRVTTAGFVTVAVTLVINIAVAAYEARRGRQLGSRFLIADAAHTSSDVIVTVGVLASQVAARYGVHWADPVAALCVLVVVARVAWRILASNLGILVDGAAVDAAKVRAAVRAVPGVVSCHRVRSRGVEGAVHLDLHLLVDGSLPVREAHAISHQAERVIRTQFPDVVDVTIHLEPDEEPEEGL